MDLRASIVWTAWGNTLQPIQGFHAQKEEGTQSTEAESGEGTRIPQQAI